MPNFFVKLFKKDKKNDLAEINIKKLGASALEKELNKLEEIKNLIESVQKADKQIRQAVLNHIFNNAEDIAKITGGDVFLNSIVGDEDIFLAGKLNFAELLEKKKNLEDKLLAKKDNDKSLEEIKKRIEQKEQRLLNLKKELSNTNEITRKWQKQGFVSSQAQEWTDVLGKEFDPEEDINFCAWLRDVKHLDFVKIIISCYHSLFVAIILLIY